MDHDAIQTARRPLLIAALVALMAVSTSCSREDRDTARSPAPLLQAGDVSMRLTQQGEPAAMPASAAPGNPGQASVKVRVALSQKIVKEVSPSATVFIFARAARGPRMPLAAVRKQVSDLPITVTLDDSQAMTPEMKLSSFPQVVVAARISKSGSATPQPGDLVAASAPIRPGSGDLITLTVSGATANESAAAVAPVTSGSAQADGAVHPTTGRSTSRLEIPPAVAATWKSVDLAIKANTGARQRVRVPIGNDVAVKGGGLALNVVAYLPAFRSGAGVVTSASNEPDNPAVLVRLLEGQKLITEGWVFQKLPQFNTFRSDRLDVRLIAASSSTGNK